MNSPVDRLDQRARRKGSVRLGMGKSRLRDQRRLQTMAQPVDEANRPDLIIMPPGEGVAAFLVAIQRQAGAANHNVRHTRATIFVPTPTTDSTENSSINLRNHGSPPPSPLLVE